MQRFVIAWLLGSILFLAVVAGINLFADAFGIMGTPLVAGLNEFKVSPIDWSRVTKPYLAARANPATLILGSSPVDVGMNPLSPAWPPDRKPVFNMGIDGVSPSALYRFEQDAFAASHPKLVIIGVTLEDSLVIDGPPRPAAATAAMDTFEPRLRVTAAGAPNPEFQTQRLKDTVFALASVRATTESLRTLTGQLGSTKTFQTPLGFLEAGEFTAWEKTEGFYVLVTDKDRQRIGTYVKWARKPVFNIDALAHMIALARDRGARVIVAIMPGYVDHIEIRRQMGISGQFDAWKARVVALAEQAGAGVTLWDFSGFSPYTTEVLPPPGDRTTRLRWFWDPVHFQPALGDLLIARLMGQGPADFGVVLTSGNLAAVNQAFHAAEKDWVAAHPADVARIGQIIAKVSGR